MKISVGIVLELHSVGIHVVYNQMNVMYNGIVARRHRYERYQSIESVKINVGSSLVSELVESQELNVFIQFLSECKDR